MDNITKIMLAIVTVALVGTVLVHAQGAASVLGAAGTTFSKSLSAAEKG